MTKPKHNRRNKLIATLVVLGGIPLLLFGVLITGVLLAEYNRNQKPIVSAIEPVQPVVPVKAPLRQDAELIAIMQRLGLDYNGLELVYGTNPELPSNRSASFTDPNKLYLSPLSDATRHDITISHEYIHYAQVKDKVKARSFYPYLNDLYTTNQYLIDRLEPYRNNSACGVGGCYIQDELQAFACTELPDSDLRRDFIDWCDSHINRSLLL